MAAVWHDPKGGSGNRAIRPYRHLDWIEGIAIAIDDQGWGRDSGQSRRCEIHVVTAVLHPARPFPQSHDLLVPELVMFTHRLPLLRWLVVSRRDLSHDRPGLL